MFGVKEAPKLGPFNGYHVFVEFPKLVYNDKGESRRVESAQDEAELGAAWQCRPDGSRPAPEAVSEPPKGKRK